MYPRTNYEMTTESLGLLLESMRPVSAIMLNVGGGQTIQDRTPLADDQKRDLGIAYHVSLQAMLRGSGTEQAWSTLACALNVALILCEQGVWASYLYGIKEAQDALLSSRDRAQKVGKWAFSGDEARLVMRSIGIHDSQMETATKGQIVFALDEVNRRVLQGEAA